MKKTIFNTYVVMESQEQCDRMKQVCIDNKMPNNLNHYGLFDFNKKGIKFIYAPKSKIFSVYFGELSNSSNEEVTEDRFLQLLKRYKNGN